MQHKRALLPSNTVKLGVGAAVVILLGILMTIHIPAPQHAIEKELDAKAFLEQKQ